MILPLRQRHRRMFAVIGVLLPIAFVAGIAARKSVPTIAGMPGALTVSELSAAAVWKRGDLFAKVSVQVELLRLASGKFAISLSTASDFVKPDLLVYWVAGKVSDDDKPPDNAKLLGIFSAYPMALPEESIRVEGALILFSLADQEIVDVSQPIRFGDSKR